MSTRVDAIFGCRIWTGRLDEEGYGRDGRRKAHILAWESAFGPVPEGFELDHQCKRRACVALHHLEAVTKAENLKRRAWRYQAVKRTHCPKGHNLNQTGVTTPEGGRVCRQCNREAKGQTT